MEEYVIGCDIDGVVANLLKRWVHIYNTDYNDSLDWEKIDEWDVSKFVKPECGKSIFQYLLDKRLYNDVEPVDNAVWGINKIRDFGYRFVFITHSPIQTAGCKFDWLNTVGIKTLSKDYIEAEDKSFFATKWLVEDSPTTLANTHPSTIPVAFTTPYNKNVKVPLRFRNWLQIVNYYSTI